MNSILRKITILFMMIMIWGCEQKIYFGNPNPLPPVIIEPPVTKILFSRVSTKSGDRTCGISTDQKFFCTDRFEKNGTTFVEHSHPQSWPIKDFELGRYHACAIFTGPVFDEVWCTGIGDRGQLGDGLSTTQKKIVKVSGLPQTRFTDLGPGGSRSCVVDESGELYCWGTGTLPGGVNSATAIAIGISDVHRVDTSFQNGCLTKNDQSLWCWGSGSSGVLGQGTVTTHNNPVQVKDSTGSGVLQNVTDFAVGFQHACAIADSEVYCWGLSRRSGLDAALSTDKTLLPRRLPELSGAVRIKSGDHHSCAQLINGDLYCWGSNRSLQIGGVLDEEVPIPKKVELGSLVALDFSLGHGTNPSHGRTCILSSDHKLYCWGDAAFGFFGSISPMSTLTFQEQPESNISQIVINKDYLCFVSNDRSYAAGMDEYNQLGTGPRYIVTVPQLLDEDPVTDVSCSHYSNCFVKAGEMYCQGYRYTNRERLAPLGNNVVRAIAGSHTTCALTTDDDLKCWGGNSNGEVGINSAVSVISVSAFSGGTPQAPTLTQVLDAGGGDNFFCAIRADKSVWCWGKNQYGTLGHNNPSETYSRIPVAVQGIPDLSSVTHLKLKVSESVACLLADQSVYCWGEGMGTILGREEPNGFIAQPISALNGNITHITPINKGVCASYSDQSVRCLASSDSLLSTFNKVGVHEYRFPKFNSPIKDLTGGLHLLCALLDNGKRHCLGNNSAGGMHHQGIAPALILNPMNWHP